MATLTGRSNAQNLSRSDPAELPGSADAPTCDGQLETAQRVPVTCPRVSEGVATGSTGADGNRSANDPGRGRPGSRVGLPTP
jgi:hypothetical protein